MRVSELMDAPPSQCPYVLQTGVMMLHPLNSTAFNEVVVGPVSKGHVATYDQGDQGIVNTLIYGPTRLFGDKYVRLHPMYNVIARHAKHTERKWSTKADGPTAAMMHFTRETRPWQNPPVQENNVTRTSEWAQQCGAAACSAIDVPRLSWVAGANDSKASKPTINNLGIHQHWNEWCAIHNLTVSHGRHASIFSNTERLRYR